MSTITRSYAFTSDDGESRVLTEAEAKLVRLVCSLPGFNTGCPIYDSACADVVTGYLGLDQVLDQSEMIQALVNLP